MEWWSETKDELRWDVNKGNKAHFFNQKWIPHQDFIRNMIQGPLKQGEEEMLIKDINTNDTWNLNNISFQITEEIKASIEAISINPYNPREDRPI